MTSELFPGRMCHATPDTFADAAARLKDHGIAIERRGRGPMFMVFRADFKGAATARRVRSKDGTHRYRWRRFGKLTAADIAYIHSLTPFSA